MEDKRVQEIIDLRNSERNKSTNTKNLYQQFADLGYPLENNILTMQSPGTDKSLVIRDSTAIKGLNRGASSFVEAFVPKDKHFFYMRINDRYINEMNQMKWWVAYAVQTAHDELACSNFDTELYNNIKSVMGFGTGCLYSEWDYKNLTLNFQDWSVANFEFLQDSRRKANTIILSYKKTALQLKDAYKEKAGPKVLKDVQETNSQFKEYEVIRIVRPRKNRDPSKKDIMNMPFEDIHINATEKVIMKEAGFPRFPFAINRWEVGSQEKWGRGCGVQALSDIKDIQQGRKDYQECCQRLLRPPVLVRDIEGGLNMLPDGQTEVMNMDDAKVLQLALPGAFPVNKDELEWRQKIIDSFFYVDIFSLFTSMTGDRRTTLEIQMKYREGLRLIGSPVARQQVELFNPLLENVILTLIDVGRIEPPPINIDLPFSLDYQGELAMAMKESQTRGFERAITLIGNAVNVFPDIQDQINLDRAMPDILTTYGMKIEHLNTPEEKEAIRQKRQQERMLAMQMAAAENQSQVYKNTQKSPEEGSPAQVMAGA